jgi:hypothetical protein
MTRSRRNLLRLFSLLVPVGMAGGAAWFLREPPPRASDRAIVELPPSAEPRAAAPDATSDASNADQRDRGSEKLLSEAKRPALESTVVFPLIVELTLTRSDFAPTAEGVAPLGSAATARLKGSIHGGTGEGVRAEVRFVGGANVGRVLYCDRQGGLGASDLYPGLSVVRVTGPGIVGSLREILLRQDRDQQLNIGYGRPATIYGQVFNREGGLLAGAKVTLDGQESNTDDNGEFFFTNVASGNTFVLVEKPGYVTYREPLTVEAAKTVDKGQLKYTLQRASRLVVDIAESINAGVPAELYLLPAAEGQRKFPWWRINPVRIYPGGSATIEDLPAGAVELRLFHAGASAQPAAVHVNLEEGITAHQTLHLKPAPVITGVVKQGGQPADHAKVRLEVPDRVKGMLATFGTSDYLFLEREVFPNLPPAVQETTTNAGGEFQLTADEDVSHQRYLVAESQDGKSTGGAVLKGGETQVDISLSPTAGGEGELVIQMDTRYQPLPVRVIVNNQPRDDFELAPDKDLHVDGLSNGSWKVSVRWDAETLLRDVPIELKKETSIAVPLPQGAIIGQDESVRRRFKRS